MGGVYLSAGKNGGSILRGRKKWGECTLAAEGRGVMSTPPQGVFGTFLYLTKASYYVSAKSTIGYASVR